MEQDGATTGFGRVLREEREKRGLSLRDLSSRIHFSSGYLGNVENGKARATEPVVKAYDTAFEMNEELLSMFTADQPAALPQVVTLVGREREQQQIRRFFDVLADQERANAPRVLLISGPPTVGTSALAVWAADTASNQYPNGVLYVDLKGYGPSPHHPRSPTEALGELLGALKVDPIGDSLTDRVQQYRTALASRSGRQRRMLIVLDNARDAQQVEPLIPGAFAAGAAVIISSYQMMSDLRVQKAWIKLDPLTQQQSADLLRSELAKRAHPIAGQFEVLDELVSPVSGSPLAIRMLAARILITHPERPADDLISELSADVDAGGPGLVHDRMSWLLDAVSPAAASLFEQLGVWRSDQAPVSREALAALTGLPVKNTVPLITELVHAHLLHELDRGRYGMTTLAARYAARLVARRDHERIAAAHRICSWYLHSTAGATAEVAPWRTPLYTTVVDGVRPRHHRNATEALEWLRSERAALAEASRVAHQAGLLTECWQLAVALRGWLEIDQDLVLWRRTHERAYLAALEQRDRIAVATVQTQRAEGLRRECRPGSVSGVASTYDEAVTIAEYAVQQWQMAARRVDSVPPHYITDYGGVDAVRALIARGEAWALRTMAALLRDHVYVDEARDAAEAALKVLSAYAPDDHEGLAQAQGVLADILRHTPEKAQLEMAELRLHDALDHLWHLGGASRIESWIHSVLAEVHLTWARVHAAAAHLPLARDSMHAAVHAVRRTGDRPAEARLRARFGHVLAEVHENESAQAELRIALKLFVELDDHGAVERVRTQLSRMESSSPAVPGTASRVGNRH